MTIEKGPMMSRRFTRTKEDFVCAHCDTCVKGNGYTNHCPQCLWSRHVDVLPGDRLALCHGMMKPTMITVTHSDVFYVHHQCMTCKHTMRVRAADNDNRDTMITIANEKKYD